MALVAEANKILYKLSDSDLELIKRLGLPNKVISELIGISGAAISMKLTRIGVKLGVENRTAIVIKAIELGLVTTNDLRYREFLWQSKLTLND